MKLCQTTKRVTTEHREEIQPGWVTTLWGIQDPTCLSNPSSTSNPPKEVVHFTKGPSSVTPAQMRSRTHGATQAGTQSKTAVQQQMKPIIKTDPNVSAAIREVQSEDEEPYMEDELEDLVNLPTDSEHKDLGDIDSEDYDNIDPEQ